MWSYYGSKSNLVNLYPPPKFDKVIEPFAGSARYALKHFDKDVLLVDKYKVIIDIWKWLQQCSEKDILSLPKFKKGDRISDFNLSHEEKLFLGMLAGVASTSPRDKISAFSAEQNGRKNKMKRIAAQLYKIKNWKFVCADYTDIQNQEATWFIDPPYEFGGNAYVESNKNINFKSLSEWCKSRDGQVIVCENTKATWMDFKPMRTQKGAMTTTTEAIWSNYPTSFDNEQISLF